MSTQLKRQHKLAIIIALGLVAIIALSAVIITILSPKKTPVSAEYITVTIDNSVSASFTLTNNDYSVTAAETYNKANSYLVKDISGTYLSFSQAIDSFLKELMAAGKLTGGSDEVLLFSVESRNEEDFEMLTSYFRDTLKQAGCSTRIYSLYIKVKLDNIQKLAEKYRVSYAKAHLCAKLEKENSKLKAEELITLSVTEIVERVNKVAAEDLLSKVESDSNEEQKNEEIPEDKPNNSSASSDGASSDITSSDNTSSDSTSSDSSSSDSTSSDSSSSDTTSSSTSSGSNVSFVVSNDDAGWLPGLH